MITAILYLLSQLIEFFIRELSELHRQFFEYHIVLCQGAGLIREQKLDPTQFLWDSRVSGYATGDVFIV
jgi:hypothetical protein